MNAFHHTPLINSNTVAIIDSNLPDLPTLCAGLPANCAIVWLDERVHGLDDVAQQLSGYASIQTLHLITHGAPGRIFVGNTTLSLESLPEYHHALTQISHAMTAEAQWFIYGCEVAQGQEGKALIDALGNTTGVTIAAATHKVGHAELGGSWELDAKPSVMLNALHVDEWRGVLATTIPLLLDGSLTWRRPNFENETITIGAAEDDQIGSFNSVTPQAGVEVDTVLTFDSYSYAYVKFTVSDTGTYSFKITDTTLSDAVIFLYGNDFAVAQDGTPSGTFIKGDDDSWDTYFDADYNVGTGGTTIDDDFWPGLKDVSLTAGTYTLVFSSFKPTDTGSITLQASSNDGTVSVTGGTLAPIPYISGKEQMIINEDANGALAISGFTLGNANNMDDTTTELTVSIAAAHGTLTLGTTSGVTFDDTNTNGTATIEFKGTIADLRTAINTLSYDPEDDNTAADPLEIKISADNGATWQPYTVDVPGKFYYAPNGHYYEYVEDNGITWDAAKTAAEAKTLYGLNGYLATVTSQAENDYIAPKLGGDGWMGASDAASEGVWKWVTGPEAGTHFFNGYTGAGTGSYSVDGSDVYDSQGNLIDGVNDTTVNVAVDGQYANWASGEPNNSDENGGEDMAHFYAESGQWNDYNSQNWDIAGYVVEYGGQGFGTLQGANLTIVTNLRPVLSDVVAVPITAGAESALQATPIRLDTNVTFAEDNYTMNWTGEYNNWDEPIAGRIDVAFVDENDNHIYSPNNRISIVSDGGITVTNEDIYYQDTYIGRISGGINGNFRVYFDTKDTVTAEMVEKVIESITYTVSDAPVEGTKIRYSVTDNTGLSSTPVDVVVNVTAENDAPTLTTSTGLIRSNITHEGRDDAKSVVTLSDGSIIVAGQTEGTIKLAKYDANGALVSAFGTGGIVETALSGDFGSPSMALDSDGKIVLVAEDYDSGNIVAMRYSSTGTLDTTFAASTNNIAVVAEGWYPKVAVLADKSIAISFSNEWEDEDYNEYETGAVAKLTSSGVLDTNFGNGGIQQITTPGSYTNEINDIMVSGDNILVTGGDSVYDSDTDDTTDNVYLATLNGSTGALSVTTTAAQSGDVWSALDSTVEGSAIGKQADGKIIVAGTADEDGVILARYNTNGTLDTTFGTNGKAAFTMFDEAQDIAIDSNDKIVVLKDGSLEVARILADGSALDSTFGEGGVVEIEGSNYPSGSELKIASDGTIWVVGRDDYAEDRAFNIVKISANGTPDANFVSRATYTVSGEAVVLDGAISVYDGELSDSNNDDGFEGATLTIARESGANANDVFSAATESYLTFDSSDVVYDGTTVGTFTQAGGTLTITFNGNAHDGNINDIMRSIAYENGDDSITEATTVDLRWTFSDGNDTAQGTGGALSDTLVQTVNIAIGEPEDETAPEITSTPVTTVDEGAQYSYTLSATDDNDVTWSVKDGETLPDWLTLGKGDAAVTIADDFTDPGGMAYDDATGDIYAVYNSYIAGIFSGGEAPQTAIYKIAEDGTKTLFTNTEFGQVGSMVIYDGYLYAGFVHDSMIGVGSNLLMRYNLSDTDGSVTPEVVLQYGDKAAANYYEGEIITGLVEKDGFMYAVDNTNSKILKFNLSDLSADPRIHVDLSATAPYPYGIAFDADGNLYGTSFGNLEMDGEIPPSVFKYDGNNVSVVMSIDGAGEQVLHGIPTDIKIDADGNFYISHLVLFPGNVSGIYKYNSDFEEQEPISTTANTWSMLFNSEGKIIAGDVQFDEDGAISGEIFGIDTANYSLTGTAPSVDADTPTEITLVATDEAGNETEHTFTITVNDVPEVTNSVTLNVANPFTPNDAEDSTPITIDAPDGISITDATNSAVTGLPKNVKMPLGQFGFTLSGLENGATVEMSMTADADFKQFSYFKKNLVTNKWVNIMEGVTMNEDGTATVKFSLTDGGVYDADRTVNGVIVDPGGVGENALLPMIAENTTEVGNVSLLDEDAATGTLSYAITGGADSAKFTINATTGLLSFNDAPNYEAPTDAGDTATNNTYAVQITVTGSISGTEVQNLIVSVLNVAEDGDNANTAPVIVGLRAEAQALTVGTAAALDDIRVADVNNNTMTVTLSATNGSIGGLTGADANTAGIQLTGDATTINTALAAATFTATAAGAAGISISVTDAPEEDAGMAITTTGYYAMTAATAPSSGGGGSTPTPTSPPTQAPTTTTVDGATVTTGTTTTPDGRVLEMVTITPITGDRQDSTGDGSRADIALYYGDGNATIPATTASLPTGVGLTATGARTPANNTEALNNLVKLINDTAGTEEASQNNLTGGGENFLNVLNQQAEKGPLIVNSVKLTVGQGVTSAPAQPITIQGSADVVAGTTGRPIEAIVIDVRDLPKGTKLELKNVEFAVIVGDGVEVIGGDGANIVYAGSGSQTIILGEDDDELYGGDGDDWIGSKSGDDKLFGDAGNDVLFGGTGNDALTGGTETDIALFKYALNEYQIHQNSDGSWTISHSIEGTDTLKEIEFAEFADQTISLAGNNQWLNVLFQQNINLF